MNSPRADAPVWSQPLDALFLSPHPDDVELFCGGSVARLVELGYEVGIADLSQGELGSNGTPQLRREESLEAARILGACMPRPMVGLPDGGLDPNDPGQLRALVEILRMARPRLLFAPWMADRHPDHEAAGHLAKRAHFFAGVGRYEAHGEPHRCGGLLHYLGSKDAEPSFVVDVSASMDRRRDAILAYGSQFLRRKDDLATPINRDGFLRGGEARLAALGARVGVEFAEGFVLEDTLLVDDLIALIAKGES